jgi:hypothetical protein
MDKKTSALVALCDEGIQHCSEPKATILFQQIKDQVKGTVAPAAKKTARKTTTKTTAKRGK